MLGFLKTMFSEGKGGMAAPPLSPARIREDIERHRARIAELQRKLPSSAALAAAEKSEAWQAGIEARINLATHRGDHDEATRLLSELREGEKKSERISSHVEQVRKQILHEEDEIEMLERALAEVK